MSLKEDVNYVKNELSNEEKLLENFVKSERFFKKYKTLIFAFVVIIIIGSIGVMIKNNIDESNKLEANIALNNYLNAGDKTGLDSLKGINKELYEIALYLEAKKDNNSAQINIPMLKQLQEFQQANSTNNVETLNNLSLQNDFLLKEFAIFNKALILTNQGKYEEAKKALTLIPQTSKAYELANLLNHYLLTK